MGQRNGNDLTFPIYASDSFFAQGASRLPYNETTDDTRSRVPLHTDTTSSIYKMALESQRERKEDSLRKMDQTAPETVERGRSPKLAIISKSLLSSSPAGASADERKRVSVAQSSAETENLSSRCRLFARRLRIGFLYRLIRLVNRYT